LNFKPSPIQKVSFRNKYFFIKRDDLLDYRFSGNKARKLYYYFEQDNIDTIISFGGTQSNLMYSLSEFAKLKNANFIYYSKPLGKYLKDNTEGNLKESLSNGMTLKEISHQKWNAFVDKLKSTKFRKNTLFINQGAMQTQAQFGIKLLAEELNKFIFEESLKDVCIFIASGTGATALFLQKYLGIKVFTTPCVGSEEYLIDEFNKIDKNLKKPIILNTSKKYHFGKLYSEFFDIYKELLNNTNIEFDLLYDPKGWLSLFENIDKLPKNIIYIHCGGILGNQSMIKRYQNIKK
jgi:1-aminocyclopropane-1-carboxylate deaminase/D-cysteine desulfhydrase-like pyridoxal-dependent ACC family enzyme